VKVLLVGGSEDLSQSISLILKVRWPRLSLAHAMEAGEGVRIIHEEKPDLVMLAFDSASGDCFDLISQIRGFSNVPLIVLSQSNDIVDKVRALEMGVDDWIPPSSIPMEFIAKVNALLRRCSPHCDGRISSFFNGKLSINHATHEIYVSGKPTKLTPIEYKILCQLAENEGCVVSSADLLHSVWGSDYEVDPEFPKKYIYRLRSKIERTPLTHKSSSPKEAQAIWSSVPNPGLHSASF